MRKFESRFFIAAKLKTSTIRMNESSTWRRKNRRNKIFGNDLSVRLCGRSPHMDEHCFLVQLSSQLGTWNRKKEWKKKLNFEQKKRKKEINLELWTERKKETCNFEQTLTQFSFLFSPFYLSSYFSIWYTFNPSVYMSIYLSS